MKIYYNIIMDWKKIIEIINEIHDQTINRRIPVNIINIFTIKCFILFKENPTLTANTIASNPNLKAYVSGIFHNIGNLYYIDENKLDGKLLYNINSDHNILLKFIFKYLNYDIEFGNKLLDIIRMYIEDNEEYDDLIDIFEDDVRQYQKEDEKNKYKKLEKKYNKLKEKYNELVKYKALYEQLCEEIALKPSCEVCQSDGGEVFQLAKEDYLKNKRQ